MRMEFHIQQHNIRTTSGNTGNEFVVFLFADTQPEISMKNKI